MQDDFFALVPPLPCLQNEFLWVPPCASLDDALNGIIENFVTHNHLSLLTDNKYAGDTWRQRHMRKTFESEIGWDCDSDDDDELDYIGPDGKRDAYHMGGSQRISVGEDAHGELTAGFTNS